MSRRRRFYRVKKETVKVDPKKVEIWNECSRDIKLITDSFTDPIYHKEFGGRVFISLLHRIRENIEQLNPNYNNNEFSDDMPF